MSIFVDLDQSSGATSSSQQASAPFAHEKLSAHVSNCVSEAGQETGGLSGLYSCKGITGHKPGPGAFCPFGSVFRPEGKRKLCDRCNMKNAFDRQKKNGSPSTALAANAKEHDRLKREHLRAKRQHAVAEGKREAKEKDHPQAKRMRTASPAKSLTAPSASRLSKKRKTDDGARGRINARFPQPTKYQYPFRGREREMVEIVSDLRCADGTPRHHSVLNGAVGVGKSAVAYNVFWQLSSSYDRQVYVDCAKLNTIQSLRDQLIRVRTEPLRWGENFLDVMADEWGKKSTLLMLDNLNDLAQEACGVDAIFSAIASELKDILEVLTAVEGLSLMVTTRATAFAQGWGYWKSPLRVRTIAPLDLSSPVQA